MLPKLIITHQLIKERLEKTNLSISACSAQIKPQRPHIGVPKVLTSDYYKRGDDKGDHEATFKIRQTGRRAPEKPLCSVTDRSSHGWAIRNEKVRRKSDVMSTVETRDGVESNSVDVGTCSPILQSP